MHPIGIDQSVAESCVQVRTGVELCQTPSTRIHVMTMLFRLKLSAFRNNLALELIPQAFAEAGVDLSSAEKAFEGLPPLPTTAAEIAERTRDVDDGRPVTERDRTISALLQFMSVAGPTIYAEHADRGISAFGAACALALTSPFARRNPCVAYAYVLQGIQQVDIGNLDLARAWHRRTDAVHYRGTSHHSSIALAHVALKYVVAKSLWEDVDYTPLYRLCSSLMDFDSLTWVAALDLATVNLTGRSTKAVLRKGREAMSMLGDDLRPMARIFITPCIQLAENMMDRSTDLNKLWREFVPRCHINRKRLTFYDVCSLQASTARGALLMRLTAKTRVCPNLSLCKLLYMHCWPEFSSVDPPRIWKNTQIAR